MHKLLIISGPTATGKTKLALHLAKRYNGELISADSRQIYKYMDVVTGKDVPKQFKIQNSKFKINNHLIPFYTDGKTKLWGYDIVLPNEQWSAAHFVKFAHYIMAEIYRRKKLSVVVGGTGLYIKNLLHPPETLFIYPNKKLRQELERLSLSQLQNELRRLNPERFSQMNHSDRQNSRRLIRAIEVAKFKKRLSLPKVKDNPYRNILHIGLTLADKQKLYRRIDRRVEDRIDKKLNKELEFLKRKDFLRYAPSLTIGYRQLIDYLDGKLTFEEAIQKWKLAERGYARNQLTWFKKQPKIHWFDITDPAYPHSIVSLVKRWYHEMDAKN